MILKGLVPLACAVLCLAACGGSSKPKEKAAAAPATTTSCASQKSVAKLTADLAAMKHASQLPTKDTLIGNSAINHATDRFLNDVALAKISNLARNRMIDHAVGTLGGECEQCFQALEAARPIPSIRYGGAC